MLTIVHKTKKTNKLNYAWFNLTCYHALPGHIPGNLQFFCFLVVYSPLPGMQNETIPHPEFVFYQFPIFLFIVAIVISILVKTTF